MRTLPAMIQRVAENNCSGMSGGQEGLGLGASADPHGRGVSAAPGANDPKPKHPERDPRNSRFRSLVGLDVGRSDQFAPFLGFGSDVICELRGGAYKHGDA